ncbi:P-loop containing nucleoside triphosphate hydrolase protein [Rhodocollybia butyracea]|uniref:P-loop containing nucleoside triphosphate hydrolase protein n=1 Tax=Rhodocollybia butyracea TaxID=206335 RepID=A0A9P5PFA7_9AGAR|nr:P-loop containing nucleoside triphosphate hydrolase protein [Rhodocollybia butyracea]
MTHLLHLLGDIPAYLSLSSLAVLSVQVAVISQRRSTTEFRVTSTLTQKAYRFLRFVGCLSLLVLTSLPFRANTASKIPRVLWNLTYTTTLASFSFTMSSIRWRAILTRHLNIVLLFTWILYAYQDLFPLATFTRIPADRCRGWALWAEIAILSFTAIAIPLGIPRDYIPVDPKNPAPVPNPEQTVSLFSLGMFFFLDPIVFEAYRVPHLPYHRLPPLADTDSAKNLRDAHFHHLDPFSGAKRRNILFNLIRSFPYETFLLWILCVISSFFLMVEPVAVNRLLNYLEQGDPELVASGSDVTMRPWFWVLVLFLWPFLDSLLTEWYLRVSLQIVVRLQALLTLLVFEHALRIRIKESDSSNLSGVSKDDHKKPSSLFGKINNLVTTDLAVIEEARNVIVLISEIPVLLVLWAWFLYSILGWSAFVGIGLIVTLSPVPIYISKIVRGYQAERMKKTDERVHVLTDIVNILRMIKLFGWEKHMLSKVSAARQEELRVLKKRQYINVIGSVLNFAIPIIAMAATYATYTLLLNQPLTASIVFSSLVVFENLQRYMNAIFMYWTRALAAKVSLDRITDFLNNTELLDAFNPGPTQPALLDESEIGFQNASFSWGEEGDGTATPSGRKFVLRIDEKLMFKKGCLNLVIGPTGSGKTSLLLSLLGEMHFMPSSTGPASYFQLPEKEESWVLNETIKNNILFASEYDEARYKEVIYACALEQDLKLFEAGDETEIGEKGLSISGGQKARLTLARAIYSNAKILLLDDVLAALDIHTAKWIVEKCLVGTLVKDRTVILVTHNVSLVEPIASCVVSIKDGKISDPTATQKADGKLVVAEEIQEGHISGSSVKLYSTALGGTHRSFYFSALFFLVLVSQLMIVIQTWFLGFWSSKYELRGTVNVVFYLSVYVAILFVAIMLNASNSVLFISGAIRGSHRIHKKLARVILGTTMRWLDQTPTSRIITRLLKISMLVIDTTIPEWSKSFLDQSMRLTLKLLAIVILTPIFLGPGIAALALGYSCAKIYLKSQMSVKREMSVAKAPVLGHFGATIAGLTSIRAYGAEAMVKNQLIEHIDKYSRSARIFYNLQRWMALRMHIISALFIGLLTWYLVYMKNDTASNTGFSINMAVTFTGAIFGWVIQMNMLEGQILNELMPTSKLNKSRNQPQKGDHLHIGPVSGELHVENLCARYSPDGPEVLHNLSFHINSGERIGVVGRTGSGKSSLALALLRCIYTNGEVIYDGLLTSSTNLDSLRSNITIIPQVPELISGTLRQNLDPFGEVDDLTLNNALRAAGLAAIQDELSEGDNRKITLDTAISGGSLSVGERQLIALARAMVRRGKLLILDEVSKISELDYKTDSIVQSSLRNVLKGDVTAISIAHRLNTVLDSDRIMVLDAGKIVEFDTPSELLKRKNGLFRALVEESNDKEELFALVKSSH